MMHDESWIDERLRKLRGADLMRRLRLHAQTGTGGKARIDFTSNDYLNLSNNPAVIAAACAELKQSGAGATGSRLLSGNMPVHERLERGLAGLKGYPAALLFGSGYMTNAGIIQSLVGRGDCIVADRLCHASILDAAVLSRARLLRFRHNDADHLDTILGRAASSATRLLVVTESVFSMDGDMAPLAQIGAAAARHDAMIVVDEAHAMGVFGPHGAGLVKDLGLETTVNVSMGTLSKALGSYGGFAACSAEMRDLFVSTSRPFIYSTGLPPSAAAAAEAALAIIRTERDLGPRLLRNAARFREKLAALGVPVGESRSQVIPVVLGENRRTLQVADELGQTGIMAAAIRPPTVPEGAARLRLSVTLAHTTDELDEAAEAIARAIAKHGGRTPRR